jgi:uncharacterized membrane protein
MVFEDIDEPITIVNNLIGIDVSLVIIEMPHNITLMGAIALSRTYCTTLMGSIIPLQNYISSSKY